MIRPAARLLLALTPLLAGCSDLGEAVGRWAAGRSADDVDEGGGEPGEPGELGAAAVDERAPGVPSFSDHPRTVPARRAERGAPAAGARGRRARGKHPVAMYIDGSGAVVRVDSVDEVPEQYRGTMIVVGKALPDGGAGGLSVVDDSAGRRATREATKQWRRAARVHSTPPRARSHGGGGVILFQTSWCPACKAARRYLDQRGIAYTARDVEKDAAARAEFARYGGSSVPLVLVNGTPIRGFNPQAIEAALK